MFNFLLKMFHNFICSSRSVVPYIWQKWLYKVCLVWMRPSGRSWTDWLIDWLLDCLNGGLIHQMKSNSNWKDVRFAWDHRLCIKMDDTHCAKMRPKYLGYRRCHLTLATSFGASVCAVVIRRSRGIEVPPIHPPDSVPTPLDIPLHAIPKKESAGASMTTSLWLTAVNHDVSPPFYMIT